MRTIPQLRIGLIGLGLIGCLASTSWAQNGEIAGTVRDSSGAVMPGVMVEAASPALIEQVRSAVSDGQGVYKIIDLRPGIYRVTFTLPGFNTVIRERLELSAGFIATINVELRVGEVSETITVTANSPIVDVQNVTQQRVMQRDIVDVLPTGKTAQNLAVLVPSVVVNNAALGGSGQDVGGSQSDRLVNLAVHGSRGLQMPYLFDGLRYDNMNSLVGLTMITITPANIQELIVDVGGHGVDSEVSGVRMNVIPKEGGNSLNGFVYGTFANRHLLASNIDERLKARGVLDQPASDRVWDFNPAIGGRIKRDRLWFYASFRHSGNETLPAAAFYAMDPTAFVFTPDRSRPAVDDSVTKAESGRLTWQVSPRNKVGLFYDIEQRCYCHRNVTSTRAPEAGNVFRAKPNWLLQPTWNSPLSNRLLLEAGVALHPETFTNSPLPEVTPDRISVTELSTGVVSRAAESHARAEQWQYNTKFIVNYVTGSHAVKVGLQTRDGRRRNTVFVNGGLDMNLASLNGVPTQVTVWTTPYTTEEQVKASVALFAQDQWKIKRLTLNVGTRFDYYNSFATEQHLPPVRWVGARDFPAVKDVPSWKDVSPRLGASYDLFGDGRTALKASVGRYIQSMGSYLAQQNQPMFTSVNSATRPWTDFNGDFIPQETELGPLSNPNFGKVNVVTRYDPDVLRGWGKRPYDWEVSTSIQHELRPGVSATATFTRHWFENKYVIDNLRVTPADYDSYCITAPLDARLPTSGQQLCGQYDITPAKFGQVDNLITFAKNYGDQQEVFTGVDLSLNVRLPRGVVLQGGTGTGRLRLNDCFPIDNPGVFGGDLSGSGVAALALRLRDCAITPPYLTQVKLLGVYPLPWDAVVSATFQSLPGPQILASYVVPVAQITPSLGRPLSGGARTATVPLIKPGTLYGDRLNQLDIRLAKNIQVGRARLQPQFDLYNLLNVNPVLQQNNTYGAAWQRPIFVLTGRLLKFGAQLTF